MARPETPYEIVAEICRKLDQQGKDPSYGLVAAELPGNPSKGTILKHIRAYKDRRDLAATVDSGLSDSFMQAAKAEIAGHLTRTTEALEKKVQEANQAADEALAELDKSETRVEALEEELKTEKKDGENYRQEAEKKEAVALQKIQDLEKRIQELEQERDQLIKAGEASRTEAAKAQMQVERADRAAALAEEKMKVLEEKLAAALAGNTDLEKRLAVTEAKREALEATERTRTTEAKERIEELKQELSGIKIALEEERKGRVEAEKQLAGKKAEPEKAGKQK
ncbi:DNA-binding protein [Trichloromonas sp.]|uniref:DNA-binding protein n=1 Tax=Trichloromonas sp. TaxID=3069249 RepID=UPI002A4D1B66|nr:DNA-binding protein [Trichloromonas sp.]